MVDVGTVVAGGAGVAVAVMAVLTLIQLVSAWPTRTATWKVLAVAGSAVAMLGVGTVVAYRAAIGASLTLGLLLVAVGAMAIAAWLADDIVADRPAE